MIELDKKYNLQNRGTTFDEDLVKSLPLPIYEAYRLLENQSNHEKSLHILCLSIIPWTYQYIALILSGEYLACSYEPSFEVTGSLINMVKKPGPGKWIGFIRDAAKYFMDHKTTAITEEAISALNTLLNTNDKPYVKIPDKDNKLDYTDALINIRNRFAHSRSLSDEKAKELFHDYFQIWKVWVVIIKEVFEPRLLFKSSQGNSFQPFDNLPLDITRLPLDIELDSTFLWNQKKETYIRLYPIIVTYSENSKTNAGVAFLEEIKSKYLFYLQGDNFFKLKAEFDILSKMIESKTITEEVVTAESLSLKTFFERIDRTTDQTINDFQDALKYIPEIFLERSSIVIKLDTWIGSNLPGTIISGNPGSGKTSLITNWCIQRKSKGDHVLLLEASRFKESDITVIIENELSLASPLKDCLESIQKQNSASGDHKGNRLIIVIDGINEFTGRDNENRIRLWREINSLLAILNLYNPYVKCLITTRSDLWDIDFPEKNSAYDMLKEKLFWGDSKNGFPRVNLGDLSLDEADEIFEKARKTLPSMAVQNSFGELSEKTKKVLCNPFLLRLALVAYNDRKMPSLTKSKIEKKYAKERITVDNDKKTVLFALVERMSELRKTEVTFDEFLYTETKPKSKKKISEKKKKNLEKLIYDPRPESSYKKLIKEGIIEERIEEGSIEVKEKIGFSQEKITDIIYKEFQRRDFKHKLKIFMVFVICNIFMLAMVFTISEITSKSFNNEIKTELSKVLQGNQFNDQIYSVSSEMVKKIYHTQIVGFGIIIIVLTIAFSPIYILSVYSSIWGARIIRNDLPSRFIKEKFNEMKQRKMFYALLIFTMIYLIRIIYQEIGEIGLPTSEEAIQLYLYCFPSFLIYYLSGEIIFSFIIIYKHANSPQDAYSLFGKKAVIQTCFKLIPVLLCILIGLWGSTNLSHHVAIKTEGKTNNLRKEWISNEAVNILRIENPETYSLINDGISDKISTKLSIVNLLDSFFPRLAKIITYSIITLFTIGIVLQYFFGILLFKILKRKL